MLLTPKRMLVIAFVILSFVTLCGLSIYNSTEKELVSSASQAEMLAASNEFVRSQGRLVATKLALLESVESGQVPTSQESRRLYHKLTAALERKELIRNFSEDTKELLSRPLTSEDRALCNSFLEKYGILRESNTEVIFNKVDQRLKAIDLSVTLSEKIAEIDTLVQHGDAEQALQVCNDVNILLADGESLRREIEQLTDLSPIGRLQREAVLSIARSKATAALAVCKRAITAGNYLLVISTFEDFQKWLLSASPEEQLSVEKLAKEMKILAVTSSINKALPDVRQKVRVAKSTMQDSIQLEREIELVLDTSESIQLGAATQNSLNELKKDLDYLIGLRRLNLLNERDMKVDQWLNAVVAIVDEHDAIRDDATQSVIKKLDSVLASDGPGLNTIWPPQQAIDQSGKQIEGAFKKAGESYLYFDTADALRSNSYTRIRLRSAPSDSTQIAAFREWRTLKDAARKTPGEVANWITLHEAARKFGSRDAPWAKVFRDSEDDLRRIAETIETVSEIMVLERGDR